MLFHCFFALILSFGFPFWGKTTSAKEGYETIEEHDKEKTVLLAILARDKAHVLPSFLQCIENLDYDKQLITVYINTNNNQDNTEEILQEWVQKNQNQYGEILFENLEEQPPQNQIEHWNLLGQIRQNSLAKTKEYNCDYYFTVDCDVFLAPCTLKEMVIKEKPIIAPLVRAIPNTEDANSNYFYDIDDKGYFKEHTDYYKLLRREKFGSFKVPLVHKVYLVHSPVIDHLSYQDGSPEWEFIIFSRNARLNNIEQYVCNELNYGTFLHCPKLSLSEKASAFKKILNTHDNPDICYIKNFVPLDVIRLHDLAHNLRNEERFTEAYQTALEGIKFTLTHPSDHWIQNYGMLWEFSLCAWSVGKFEEAIDASKKLLRNPRLTEQQKNIVKRNTSYLYSGIQSLGDARQKWGAPPWENPHFEKKTRSDLSYTIPKVPKLHICTVATYECDNLHQLMDSCAAQNIPIDILGTGKPFNFGLKLNAVKEYLENIPEDDVVMFVDAFDTLVLADEQTILNKFHNFNSPVVFSVETGCHPFIHLCSYYPPSPTKFKYLNSGSYIGYAGCLKQILDEISPIPAETDDQGLLTVYYLYHPHNIALDYTSELFIAFWKVNKDEIYIDTDNKKVDCLITTTTPCVIHANSNTTPLYQLIYDTIFHKTEESPVCALD